MKRILLVLIASALASGAMAHSGGTDDMGCHNDHKKGTYHCH